MNIASILADEGFRMALPWMVAISIGALGPWLFLISCLLGLADLKRENKKI